VLFLPYGEATVAVTASIAVDGQVYSGRSVWRVTAQTQNGWPDSGINYRQAVFGDAIEFDLGNDTYAFLRPDSGGVMCAGQEHPDVTYRATALSRFRGPCNAQTLGALTFVDVSSDGPPSFVNFRVSFDGQLLNDGRGSELSPEIEAIEERNFALLSVQFAATAEGLPRGMIERFPWILELPRTDIDDRWRFGNTYMQYFTTDLPE
jgi:hypothetical protein